MTRSAVSPMGGRHKEKYRKNKDLHGAPWFHAGVGGVHLLLGGAGLTVAGEQTPAALSQMVQHGCTRPRDILTICHYSPSLQHWRIVSFFKPKGQGRLGGQAEVTRPPRVVVVVVV